MPQKHWIKNISRRCAAGQISGDVISHERSLFFHIHYHSRVTNYYFGNRSETELTTKACERDMTLTKLTLGAPRSI